MKGLLVVCALALSSAALAQDPVRGPKVTTLNFEDEAIDGALTRPDGEHVQARAKVKHGNLIRVRSDFTRKAMQALGDLK